jgi:hypothetical protein
MPEFEAVKPGKTGALFEYGSVPSLVNETLKWLVNNSSSREQIRQACFEIIDHFYNPTYQTKEIKLAISNHLSGQKHAE